MQEAPRIDLLLCFDEGFLHHAATSLYSFLFHNRDFVNRVHLAVAFESHNIERLRQDVREQFQVECFVYVREVPNLATHGHVSNASYLRLLAPDFVNYSSDWLLYLDSDLVTLKDVALSLKTSVEGSTTNFLFVPDERVKRIHWPQGVASYFNSGVALVNVPAWKRESISEKCQTMLDSRAVFRLWDQDILNVVLNGEWSALPRSMNVPQDEYESRTAEILHFMGPEKPWHAFAKRPVRHLYMKYRALTPFAWTGPEVSLKLVARYLLRRIRRVIKSFH